MTEALHPDDVAAEKASATWKFDFLDTVNADPLANGECLGVLKAYLSFASASKPLAYCSLPELAVRTGSSFPAIRRAKAKARRLGYMILDHINAQGAEVFRLVNARKEIIDLHMKLKREAFAETKRERRQQQRQRNQSLGRIETLPPDFDGGYQNVTSLENETLPNTLEATPRVYLLEGRADNRDQELSRANPYLIASSGEDDPTVPFDIPSSDEEAQAFIESAGTFPPVIAMQLRRMLMAGELTPSFLSLDLGRKSA